MSMIQKVSMGVSKPAATTNQYCISESLSIDVLREGYVDQTDGRNRVDAVIFYAQRPVSVLSSVTNTSDCFFFTVFDSEIGCVSGTRVHRIQIVHRIMTTPEDEDGVTVTWHATPVGTCAVLIGRPIDECPSCRPDGRCQLCGLANGTRVQGCTLPKALCQNGPCPVKPAPTTK